LKRLGIYLIEHILIRPFKFWKIRGYEVEIKYEPIATPAMGFEVPKDVVKKFNLYSDAVDYFNVESDKPLYDKITLNYIDKSGDRVMIKRIAW